MFHLRANHNANYHYDAWIICQELLELRELRLQTKRKGYISRYKERENRRARDSEHDEVPSPKKRLHEDHTTRETDGLGDRVDEGGEREGRAGGGRRGENESKPKDRIKRNENERENDRQRRGRGKYDSIDDDDDGDDDVELAMKVEADEIEEEEENRTFFDDDVSSDNEQTAGTEFEATKETFTNRHLSKTLDGNSTIKFESTFNSASSPIHLNVGGKDFATSRDTLLKFPESRLGRICMKHTGTIGEKDGKISTTGNQKQRRTIFIDRDGKLFRYILNFCRTSKLVLPKHFEEIELLHEEAVYYGIPSLIAETKSRLKIEEKSLMKNGDKMTSSTSSKDDASPSAPHRPSHDCVMVRVYSPSDSFISSSEESIQISATKNALVEAFPETARALDNLGIGLLGSWEIDKGFVLGFPLKECTKLNLLSVFQRLMDHDFSIKTCYKGEKDGSYFMEHLFVRGKDS